MIGASQELQLLALPLHLATVAATWSLLRKRAHYPTDILAGGLLGLGVALTVWKLWPPMVLVDDATAGEGRADGLRTSAA